ncbi:MAG TPA: hypothetical protein PLG78_04820 [Leptospiraceae bacterium]|nr:hypothetical protein [Leptospiraceae bacterium]
MFLLPTCRTAYPFYVERPAGAIKVKLYLLESDYRGERNQKAVAMALSGKWAEALGTWTEMKNRKLAIDCGLFSNYAISLYMNGEPAWAAMEQAVRMCPDDNEVRHNFRMLSVLQ